jgi:hypothetical protein
MTSLAAWVAVDARAASSFYLISDSRISFEDGRPHFDSAQKLFASSGYPDLFGYCGYVDFPAFALPRALRLINEGRLFSDGDDADVRNAKFNAALKESFDTYPSKKDFTILHAARSGDGMKSSFFLWSSGWSLEQGWITQRLELPVESAIVLSVGSGGRVTLQHNERWRHLLPRTSRSVFSAFVDALESGEDPKSGGALQLVGLYRNGGGGRYFGVIQDGKRFLMGKEIMEMEQCVHFEWRNKLFEPCDFRTLERLPSAQRHHRPKAL